MDVEVEEDWTRTVTSMPTIRPTTGFEMSSLFRNEFAFLPPISLKAMLISSREQTNVYIRQKRQANLQSTRRRLFRIGNPLSAGKRIGKNQQ